MPVVKANIDIRSVIGGQQARTMSAYSCASHCIFKPTLGQILRVDSITISFVHNSILSITGMKTHDIHEYNQFSNVAHAHLCLLFN